MTCAGARLRRKEEESESMVTMRALAVVAASASAQMASVDFRAAEECGEAASASRDDEGVVERLKLGGAGGGGSLRGEPYVIFAFFPVLAYNSLLQCSFV